MTSSTIRTFSSSLRSFPNITFKAAKLTPADRTRIFEDGHPIARADVLVDALEVIRLAVLGHIHGYSGIPADKNDIINKSIK